MYQEPGDGNVFKMFGLISSLTIISISVYMIYIKKCCQSFVEVVVAKFSINNSFKLFQSWVAASAGLGIVMFSSSSGRISNRSLARYFSNVLYVDPGGFHTRSPK